MSKHITTKSQSELVGLAMVVVLIVLGLLVVVSFSLRSIDPDISIEYQHEQLPVLLNDAILEAHTSTDLSGCYGEQIKKLLLKVAQNENFVCNNDPVKDFLKTEIQSILDDTLHSWYITYRYTIYTGLDYTDSTKHLFDVFTNSDDDCLNQNIKTENFFFSMTNGDFLNMKMDICYD